MKEQQEEEDRVVRVKRRRDEPPLNMLVVETIGRAKKRMALSEALASLSLQDNNEQEPKHDNNPPCVFRFVGTISSQSGLQTSHDVKRHVETLKRIPLRSPAGMTPKEQIETRYLKSQGKVKNSRFSLVSSRRKDKNPEPDPWVSTFKLLDFVRDSEQTPKQVGNTQSSEIPPRILSLQEVAILRSCRAEKRALQKVHEQMIANDNWEIDIYVPEKDANHLVHQSEQLPHDVGWITVESFNEELTGVEYDSSESDWDSHDSNSERNPYNSYPEDDTESSSETEEDSRFGAFLEEDDSDVDTQQLRLQSSSEEDNEHEIYEEEGYFDFYEDEISSDPEDHKQFHSTLSALASAQPLGEKPTDEELYGPLKRAIRRFHVTTGSDSVFIGSGRR